MEAQTVMLLVFLALIKNVSTSDPRSPVKYPPTEPKLYMRSEVTEGQTITIACRVKSFPQSTLNLMRIDKYHQSLKITENNLYSRPINSLDHTFTVTSADAGWYFCRAQNTEGSKDSKQKKLVVKFSPKHTNITESSEKQELDGRSSVMLNCFSHSFPPVQHYSWYRKSPDEDKDEIVSEHQNHTVYSNQSGVYYCVAENQSLSDPVHMFEHPPTEPILSMSSEVTEGQTITIRCIVESFPQSTLTLMRVDKYHQSLKITGNNLNSRPINSLSHEFTVTSSDAGWYFCRAQNTEGSKDSEQKKLVVKFSPKHTHITESAEKQELDGRSSVMLSCFSHSFPPVHNYSWYRKSQGEEKDELVSEHQNHTVYSNQPGVYYCIAQNEVDQSLSDPVHLFEPTGDYLENLRFFVVALLLLMIISVIVVNLRYWRKSVQQGTTNTKSPSGFSNEPESLQDYDDVGNATARAPTSPNLLEDHTSEGEVELNFPQVRFTATPRRQTNNRDSSSSHQDES